MKKWRKNFHDCWEKEKYEKFVFNKRYQAIWPTKPVKKQKKSKNSSKLNTNMTTDNSIDENL